MIDVTQSLQTQLNEWHAGTVAPGVYYVSDTIEIPRRAGVHIQGAGVAAQTGKGDAGHSGMQGRRSALVWVGPPNKPMFRFQGSDLRIDGLMLCGRPYKSDQEKCAVGIELSKGDRGGFATGRFNFGTVQLIDFKLGILNGATSEEANCEANYYQNLYFKDCDRGIELRNSQGMGHYFGYVHCNTANPLFDVYGGGMVHANCGHIGGALLRVNANTPPKFTTGHANGTFRFDNIKVDAQNDGGFMAVDMTSPEPVDVYLNCGRLSQQDYAGTFARMQGRSSLTVRDWVGVLKIESKADARGRKPNVLLDRCRLWKAPNELLTGDGTYTVRDCFGWQAEKLGE